MQREKFIVLDVEGMSGKRPYNIGYIIADKYGKIYKKRSFALPSTIWENISESLRIGQAIEMTKQNVQEILADYNKPKRKRKYQLVSEKEFFTIFQKEISHYKIKRIFAYNVLFDKTSISKLISEDKLAALSLEWNDIISGILTTKLLTKKYVEWCFTNNFVTPTGLPSYKAEVVYRYLTNQLNFEEEHTGLADTLIEYQILLVCFNSKKKLNFTPCCAWKKLKDFIKKNNLTYEPKAF